VMVHPRHPSRFLLLTKCPFEDHWGLHWCPFGWVLNFQFDGGDDILWKAPAWR
jgi:hypothetical protein